MTVETNGTARLAIFRIDWPVMPDTTNKFNPSGESDESNSQGCNHHDAELNLVHSDLISKWHQNRSH